MLASPAISRNQTLVEEIGNSVSHGLGLLLAILALPMLVQNAVRNGPVSAVVGSAVFGGSVIALYLASVLYHATWHRRTKNVLRVVDHAAIYILIAGTYTPFTLGVLRGTWGWILFGLVWSMALLGVLFKTFAGMRFPRVSTLLYVAMGWVVLIAIQPLWQRLPIGGWAWLLAGGLAYTFGVIFFALDARVRYCHCIWHLFVVVGTTCHFVAVLRYAY
ncbi:MAG TPA: hemolysin III family protein [Rhodanobacteraceae bacterium]|nr:hemolysin III family protein [Rhodanobacteraceae bacterium]